MKQTFITTKIVSAKSMLAIDAETKGYRTNDVPSETAGYEVTYEDGYKSWCPIKTFLNNAIDIKSEEDYKLQ